MASTDIDNSIEAPWRILFLIDGLEGDGAERQLCELVKGLHELDDYEPHVGVLEADDSGHAWILEEIGIKINVFARASRFDLSPVPRIVKYIRQHRIHIVHAYMSMGSEFGLIAGKICRIPVITSSIRNGMNRDWRERVRTFYQSHLADLAVANSKAGFTSRFKNLRKSFRVVYNGFDVERFNITQSARASLREEFAMLHGKHVICMAARMERQKDHRTLLDAIHLLRRTEPDAMLLLAGDGELRDDLDAYCRYLGIQKNVRFIGHRRDIECVISICDVSVLLTSTDIHREGISNTIIESMAVGTAVLATRGGGTDEILGDNDAGPPPYQYGIKVDPYNSSQVAEGLSYYLNDELERTRIAEAARSMVLERFNLSRFINDNVQLYRELAQKMTRRSPAASV